MTVERSPYDLLPAIHRIRDAERGEPLRALLAVVEDELHRLVEDVDDLYDNWFIETCDEWVIPYIADLLGVQGIATVPGGVTSQRAFVANTIAYRRRKGTPAVLEQLARDATGWPARVVEYFRLLGVTQHLDHVRPSNVRTPDVRDSASLALVDTPFDPAPRSVDVRHVDVGRGRHNIPNVGLFLWRLGAYAVTGVDARAIDRARGRWTFDPVGRDMPLFNRPKTEPGITHLATEVDLPTRLRRRPLHEELTAVRAGAEPVYLAEPRPALVVRLGDVPVDPAQLVCCDLTTWRRPSKDMVAVDPVLGRLTFPEKVRPLRVLVDYAYGSAGDLGAGPYDRRATLVDAMAVAGMPPWLNRDAWQSGAGWQIGVSRDLEPVPGQIVRTVGEALRLWEARPRRSDGQVGVITVLDSATYAEDISIEIPPGDRLLLLAATWPEYEDPVNPGRRVREPGSFVAREVRPHLIGTVEVVGGGADEGVRSEFVLSGFLVEGQLTVAAGDLSSVILANCTVTGDHEHALADGGVVSAVENPHLTVRLLRTICRAVRLHSVPGLGLTDCIVHVNGDLDAMALEADAHVEMEACTILGRTTAGSLAASNTILRGMVGVERRQEGCVRFSYLPLQSRAPRRHRCQPTDEESARAIAPVFTSVEPTDPGFGQLAGDCPREIATGADDEGEMGVFGFLRQHRRRTNLVSQLDTYLRFGLEAGLFYVT